LGGQVRGKMYKFKGRTAQVTITRSNWTFGVWWIDGKWFGIDLGPLEVLFRCA
jgi:hypothetical protein